MRRVHRLVLENFSPIMDMKSKEVNHIDNNPSNNCLSNLEWCDGKTNLALRKNSRPHEHKPIKVIFANGKEMTFSNIIECSKYFNIDTQLIRGYINKKRTSRRQIQADFFYLGV